LAEIGIEPERLEMFNLSAAMAGEFVKISEQMTDRIKALGPNPLRADPDVDPAENINEERA